MNIKKENCLIPRYDAKTKTEENLGQFTNILHILFAFDSFWFKEHPRMFSFTFFRRFTFIDKQCQILGHFVPESTVKRLDQQLFENAKQHVL